jgi:transcriptional regulator with GAF, ATPase, and Fis domain
MIEDRDPEVTIVDAIAHLSSALVTNYTVGDVLARLVDDASEVLHAEAVGVLVAAENDQLELLSATSHTVAELELFQIQVDEGPCIEAMRTGAAVSVQTAEALTQRWQTFGPAASQAGYRSVHASPMLWQGTTLGAFNVFRTTDGAFSPLEETLAQALADVATIAIVRAGRLSIEEVLARTAQALAGRHVIEQAKGVLAYNEDLDMSSAYSELKSRAAEEGVMVTEYARLVIKRAIQS